MDFTTLLICDSATTRDNLLHVLGGGITRLWRSTLPAPLGVAFAMVLELEPDELAVPHEIHLTMTDSAGRVIAELMGALEAAARQLHNDENALFPHTVALHPVTTERYGRHELTISIDQALTRTLVFYVLHPDERHLPGLHD